MVDTKTSHSIKNASMAIIMSLVVMIMGFITHRVFIHRLGVEYAGINGLFSNIVSMLNIAELGLGTAMVYFLYQPMAKKQTKKISQMTAFYARCYFLITVFISAGAIVILPFLSAIIGETKIIENLYIIHFLFVIDTVASYLFAHRKIVLYADQLERKAHLAHITAIIFMNLFQIFVLKIFASYYIFLVIKIISRLLENGLIYVYTNRRYSFLRQTQSDKVSISLKRQIIKKVKGLFYHKISSFVIFSTDNIIISSMLGIKIVGYYSNYYMLITALLSIIGKMFSALTASIGTMIATSSNVKKYKEVFYKIDLINLWFSLNAAIGFLFCASPFVNIWLGKKFVLDQWVVLALSFDLFLQLSRSSLASFKEGAGIFYEDRFVPVIESVTNIVLSIILAQQFGLLGVFLGTIGSKTILFLYSYPKFVYGEILKLPLLVYLKDFSRRLLCYFISAVAWLTIYILKWRLGLFASLFASLFIANLVFIILFLNNTNLHWVINRLKYNLDKMTQKER